MVQLCSVLRYMAVFFHSGAANENGTTNITRRYPTTLRRVLLVGYRGRTRRQFLLELLRFGRKSTQTSCRMVHSTLDWVILFAKYKSVGSF